MTEKHPSRNTKSLGPNFNKMLSLGTDSSYIITSKREHKQNNTQNSETDIFTAKTHKSPNNPVLSYKGNEFYSGGNKSKTTKAANVYSNSISNNYNPIAESEAERLLRQSPITTDEMAWYQLMEIEKNRKGMNFGTLALDEKRNLQKTLGFQAMAAKIDQRSPGYMTFQPKQKKKQIAPHKLPALDESRIAGTVPLKKRTDSLIQEISPTVFENARLEKNMSVKKLQQTLFEANHRARSPKLLMNRKGPMKKEEGVSISHTKQYSVPFTEVYNEIASKIFGQGVTKANSIFGRNNGGESSEENRYRIYDKKVSEYFSPNRGKLASMTQIKVGEEAFAEKSFDDLMQSGLKISRLKPTLAGLSTSKTMTSEASPSPSRKFRKMGTYELANPESEESEDEFQRPVYKRSSIIKFNQEKPNLKNEETHIREETQGSSSQESDPDMIKTDKSKVKVYEHTPKKSLVHMKDKHGDNNKGESEKKSTVMRSSKIVVETEEKNAIVNLKNTRKVVKTITSTPKNPEAAAEALYAKKLEVYKEFMAKMNLSYNLCVKLSPEKAFVPYKFSIGKGNNHMLLRSLMKNRWWWKETDSKNPKEINFLWTQWRNKKYFESLPTVKVAGKVVAAATEKDVIEKVAEEVEKVAAETVAEEVEKVENPEEVKSSVEPAEKVEQQQEEVKTEEWKQIEGDGMKRLFTKKEISLIEAHHDAFKGGKEYEEVCKQKAGLKYKEITEPSNFRICNHVEDNFHISNKKALWVNMKAYYTSIGQNVAKYLPLTFHVKNGFEDEEFQKFLECYKEREREIQEQETAEEKGKNNNKKARNLWIVKPGENTNKGKGISLMNDLEEIKEFISSGKANKESRTYLIQSYLDRPLLYNKRKFDIRCYMLISCINGVYKGYWYQEGYFRTSSKEFSVKNVSNKQIHLTNDAIQKKYDEYGKWESGNKVSYAEFEKYLEHTYGGNCDFYKKIYPQMKSLATDTIKAVYGTMDPHNRENTFEVFGLDFMIDASFNVWLIEVNTNPDITIPTPKLGILIPAMVENALRLTIDPLYPPPFEAIPKKQCNLAENIVETNKFELVFDELEEGEALRKTLKTRQEALKVLSSDPNLDEEGSGDDE